MIEQATAYPKRIITLEDAKIEVLRIPGRTKLKIVEHELLSGRKMIAIGYLTDQERDELVQALTEEPTS